MTAPLSSYLAECREPEGYLDFARFGPPPRAVLRDATELLASASAAGPSTVDDLLEWEVRARAAVARLCHTDVDHVALLPNTSTGLFQAALAMSGGEVIVSAAEFPANTYPWVRAEEAGRIRLRRFRPVRGRVTPDALRDVLSRDTTAVSVSAVDYRTGYRADLAAIRDVAADRLLIVDGIQGFGVMSEPWSVADVLVVGGQKWLRAGWSTGFLVLSDRALARLRPVLSGWTGARQPGEFDEEIHAMADGAAGWSITNLSPISAGSLARALDLVDGVGVPVLQRRVSARVDELTEIVHAHGGEVVSERDPDRRAGILAFTLPGVPPRAVGAALTGAGVTATIRREHVRLSPHASTTDATVARVGSALRNLRRNV